jgi:DNA helicase-2/ATP-dependent DNA helicase PcrA
MTERVTLMTVHAAKGLEFAVVFIAGMEENLFPSQFCVKPNEIEEERRLLYVAITRAMERCYLSFARQRFRNGQMAFNSPSRFLQDIDRQFFTLERPTESKPSVPKMSIIPSMHSIPAATMRPVGRATTPIASEWKTGDRVMHRVFGKGEVLRVYRDEVTENDKIEIAFDTAGTKTLLLSHAKLERES